MATLHLPSRQPTSSTVPLPSPPIPNRTQIESYGTHCTHSTCHQLDFLPLLCPSCHSSFCSSHFSPLSHSCPSYDPSKHDRRVPSCPICKKAVPIPRELEAQPDGGVNEAVGRHLDTCEGLGEDGLAVDAAGGKVKRVKGKNECKVRGCRNKWPEGAGFRCDKCRVDHCATHRMANDHACSSIPSTSTSTSTSAAISKSKAKKPQATAAVVKPAKPIAEEKDEGGKKFGVGKVVAGLKEDKRARQERESREKAIKMRMQKGLLTDAEKMEIATKAAIDQRENGGGKKKKGKKDGDCCIS